jgi:hypothetical protein
VRLGVFRRVLERPEEIRAVLVFGVRRHELEDLSAFDRLPAPGLQQRHERVFGVRTRRALEELRRSAHEHGREHADQAEDEQRLQQGEAAARRSAGSMLRVRLHQLPMSSSVSGFLSRPIENRS